MRFIKKDAAADIREKNFSSDNMVFFARRFSPKEGLLEDITIFEESKDGDIVKKITCSRMAYTNQQWQGTDVTECALDNNGNFIGKPNHYSQKVVPLKDSPHELSLKKGIMSQFASLKELKREIRRLKKIQASHNLSERIIEYHKQMTAPFGHFFMILGILPFTLEIKKRKATLSFLGLGLMVSVAYYALIMISTNLGRMGILIPVMSAWVTPLFFLTVGITGLLLLR